MIFLFFIVIQDTYSVFEVGKIVADSLNDKATIYADFNDRSQVKTLGCYYDFVNLFYRNGSLYYFLYPILLFYDYKDNHIVERCGAKFNAKHNKFLWFSPEPIFSERYFG